MLSQVQLSKIAVQCPTVSKDFQDPRSPMERHENLYLYLNLGGGGLMQKGVPAGALLQFKLFRKFLPQGMRRVEGKVSIWHRKESRLGRLGCGRKNEINRRHRKAVVFIYKSAVGPNRSRLGVSLSLSLFYVCVCV